MTEEMPASHVKTALEQMEERLREELSEAKIEVEGIKTFGTCRRLGMTGLIVPKQQDREEFITGPPKTLAFEEDGSYSRAAVGFARAQGVNPDDLQIINTEKGEYLGLKKVLEGKSSFEILKTILPQIISSLTFPKMMRWGSASFKFSRPIQNILCLFGGKVVPFKVAGVESKGFTFGHKIHFPQRIEVNSFKNYTLQLEKLRVIVEPEKRRKIIEKQMERKLAALEANVLPDEELVEEVCYDVESPYVFIGSFPVEYMALPIEVLSTAMRVDQKLFSVVKGEKPLPYFIGVADTYRDSKSFIKKGNERVLKARLEDARFFWEQDLKLPLHRRANALKEVVFQENLGSYLDKAMRLKEITSYLAEKIDQTQLKSSLALAAELCKADLVSEMVREFPSLQGKMGGLYARVEGYQTPVWKAIYEHYQPAGLEDESPPSMSGALLSIADKMDSFVGTVGVGVRVTGSKDPFGLRRLAHGVCKVILEKKLSFSFSRFIDKVLKTYGKKLSVPREEIKKHCLDFFAGRLQFIFERQGYRYDLINASIKAGIDNIYHTLRRLVALDSLKSSPHFEDLVLIAKRVNNIIHNQPLHRIEEGLLVEKEERELYTTFSIIKENVMPMIARGNFAQAQRMMLRLRTCVNKFFDKILVMCEDKKMRRNRLALLQQISRLLLKMADYSQIVIER